MELFSKKRLVMSLVLTGALASAAEAAELSEDYKAPMETQAVAVTMINRGSDLIASVGFDKAATAVADRIAKGKTAKKMTPYMVSGNHKLKVKTGSHADVKGLNTYIGLAKQVENKAGRLIFGPVLEYGRGDYDTYLDNGNHSDGKTRALGAGLIAKQYNNSGVYLEGSLRAGRSSAEYKGAGNYDSKSTYYAAHFGIGKVAKLSEKNSLDYYTKLFYSRQGGDKVNVGANGYDFDAAQSLRSLVGTRFTHKVNDKHTWYAGLAWQREFQGEAKGKVNVGGLSYAAPEPCLKGNTGIAEFAWNTKISRKFIIGMRTTGYVGQQKGIGLNLNIDYKI